MSIFEEFIYNNDNAVDPELCNDMVKYTNENIDYIRENFYNNLGGAFGSFLQSED